MKPLTFTENLDTAVHQSTTRCENLQEAEQQAAQLVEKLGGGAHYVFGSVTTESGETADGYAVYETKDSSDSIPHHFYDSSDL